jgi:alkenylglycerophosphocholine/alkenylglycerophosphoethanolamine hydrolase
VRKSDDCERSLVTPLSIVLVVTAALIATVDWWSVAADRPGVEYYAKPMVIVALVGLALAVDASHDTARGLVIAALGASLVGDVVLLSPDASLVGGLGAFLVAHPLYIAALAESAKAGPTLAGAIVVVGLSLGVVPQLISAVWARGPGLAIAVALYVVAVDTTAILAVGTGVAVAAAGGLLLLASDALLGWARFVGPAPGGRTLVHVTYHAGQTGMVLWLAA